MVKVVFSEQFERLNLNFNKPSVKSPNKVLPKKFLRVKSDSVKTPYTVCRTCKEAIKRLKITNPGYQCDFQFEERWLLVKALLANTV